LEASRAPQTDIERLKARMGWTMPWYTIRDSFDILAITVNFSKGWRRRFNSLPGHHYSKRLTLTLLLRVSPLSVRFHATRVALEVVDSKWWKQELRVKSAGCFVS
jgi:hypothetical protein